MVAEPTGAELHLTLSLGGQTLVVVTRERVAAQPGHDVLISFDSARAHCFDGETGQRL